MSPIRLPHLTWRQRAAATAAVLAVGLAGGVTFAPAASAHTAAYTLTPGPCTEADGMWTATVDIAGTFLELNPTAVIDNPASALVLPVPAHYVFDTAYDTFTVGVVVTWSDGFTQDLGRQTVTRPDTCVPPTTTTCPDCTPTQQTFPPETTTVPVVDTTIANSPTTTVSVPSTSAVPPSSQPPTVPAGPSTTLPALLPATGAGEWILALVIVGGLTVLVGLILVFARRNDRTKDA